MITSEIFQVLFNFMLVFVAFMIAFQIVVSYLLKKGKIDTNKLGIYGLFMGMTDLEILALSSLTIRYLFVFWTLLDSGRIFYIHLIILLFLSLVYALCSKNILALLFEIISCFGIYLGLLCSRILVGYLNDVMFQWYVFIANLALIIFILLYLSYFFVKGMNDLVVKSKLIKGGKNERKNTK